MTAAAVVLGVAALATVAAYVAEPWPLPSLVRWWPVYVALVILVLVAHRFGPAPDEVDEPDDEVES